MATIASGLQLQKMKDKEKCVIFKVPSASRKILRASCSDS